jgi:hypothetical protein
MGSVCLHQAAAAIAIVPRWAHESSVPVVHICPVTSHCPRRPQLRDQHRNCTMQTLIKKRPLNSDCQSRLTGNVKRERLRPGGTRTKLMRVDKRRHLTDRGRFKIRLGF